MFCMSPLIAWHVCDRKTLQIIFTETVGEVSRLTLPLSFAAHTHTHKKMKHIHKTPRLIWGRCPGAWTDVDGYPSLTWASHCHPL